MPTISRFLGMIITMYLADHAPPHFHVRHGKYRAVIDIQTGRMLRGKLPKSALKPLEKWRILHMSELQENWRRREHQIPLEKIPPLTAE